MTEPVSPEDTVEKIRQRMAIQDAEKRKVKGRRGTELAKEEEFLGRIRELTEAKHGTIDIRSLVLDIITEFKSLHGLGKAAVALYHDCKTEAQKTRLMIEFLKLVNNLSGEGDDLPDDPEDLRAIARQLLEDD